MKHSDKTYCKLFTPLVHLLWTARPLTSDSSSTYFGLPVRLLLTLLLLTASVSGTWGQDYSGTYYIASYAKVPDSKPAQYVYDPTNPTNPDNYYLCPSDGWIYYKKENKWTADKASSDGPFLTTFKCRTDAYNTYGGMNNAKWVISKHGDYYAFYHTGTNKHMVLSGQISGCGADRMRVHLEEISSPENPSDEALFTIAPQDHSLSIAPCTIPADRLTVNGGNKDALTGQSGKTGGPKGTGYNYENTAGIVGIYRSTGTDDNRYFYLEEVFDRPTFTSNSSQIVIGHSEGNTATIYYTIDGTNPTTTNCAGSGAAPLQIDMPENAVTLKAIAVINDLPSCISSIQVVPNPIITLAANEYTYDGSAKEPTVSSVMDGETPIANTKYNVTYNNNINAGTATVNIEDIAGDDLIVYGSKTFTINKKDLTITANNHTISYGDAPADNGVTCEGFVNSETIAVLEGTLEYAYNYEQYGNVGNYTITPSGLTSTNYNITYHTGTLTVEQKEVGLTWSETTSFPYDGTSHGLTATATNLVNGDEIGITVTGDQTNAGNHTATASALTGEKAGNYKLPNENTHAFTITPVGLTVTAKDHSITYGDAPAGNGVTYSGFIGTEDESVLGGKLDYDFSYSQYDDAGNTYTITPKGLTSSNYNISYVTGTLTVNPKALSIIADAKSKAYGDTDPALTYTSEGLVGTDAITGALNREAGEAIGTYAIYQNTVTAGSNYTVTYTGANFTITPKPLTITAKPKAITYGDAPTNDGVTYSGFAPGEDESVLEGTLAYAYNYVQYDDAGDYHITPCGLTGDNYNISFVAGTLTVNPKEVGITWGETTTFVYDANSHAPTATATGLLNGDEVSVSVTGQQTNVGDGYTATASGLTGDKADNYTIDATYTENFSITPAELTITAKDRTISYGDEPSNWGVDYEGFKGDDNEEVLTGTLAYAYNYEQYDELGDYTITPSGLTGDNYNISFVAGTLTVKERTIALKWTNTSFTYDREAHQPAATAVGTVNSEEIGITLTVPTAINAGSYTATASGLTGAQAAHYELPTNNTHIFTIAPKSLGDGDLPAEDITISLTSVGELDYVKDGDITLTTDEDYTYDIQHEGSDKIVAVTGIGNYTGSIRGIYAQPHFYDTGGSGERKNVAVYMSSRDVNNFEGVYAYTVKSVNTFLGVVTVNKLDYIPKGVPVLLLSASASGETGYVVEEKNESIADISESTVNSNLLKMAPEGGVPVETAQVYLFYEGEFVLTKAGTITEGKFYLHNPNYTETPADPGASPARGTLLIVEEDPTGMGDAMHLMNNGQLLNNHWYDLQGRKIENHKLSKGLYIHNGRKVIVK